jgi:SagB-type dehydrogenase family enzyme
VTASVPQVVLDGLPLATLVNASAGPLEPVDPDGQFVISRFAWLRRQGDSAVVETSLGSCVVVLQDARARALFITFSAPRRLDGPLAGELGLPLGTAQEIASLLYAGGLLIDADGARSEDEPPLALWEFHDLLFHSRSRLGRYRERHGATYPVQGRFSPEAALPPARWPDAITLDPADVERFEREDPPFALVQSRRRSIRNYGESALTLGQLGDFLARVNQVQDYWESSLPGAEAETMSFAARPYPAGGAMYELEVYPAVRTCEGLDPGLYHYASGEHRLQRVSAASAAVNELIGAGATAMGAARDSMQVLIVLTARIPRIAWKYESIAYALVLKDVGVLLQTMYLTATAMELAPCAIGSGDSDLFAQASGIDYYEESAVGEFALGSRSSSSPLRS